MSGGTRRMSKYSRIFTPCSDAPSTSTSTFSIKMPQMARPDASWSLRRPLLTTLRNALLTLSWLHEKLRAAKGSWQEAKGPETRRFVDKSQATSTSRRPSAQSTLSPRTATTTTRSTDTRWQRSSRPSTPWAWWSVLRALLTPCINSGSLYRLRQERLRAAGCPRQEEKGA